MNKRSGLLATGIVLLIVGLLAGAGLWYSAGAREADAVRNLARAPIGCDTTLEFEAGGEFLVFVETDGRFRADVEGDCDRTGSFGSLGSTQELPPVRVTLTDEGGDEISLDARAGVTYDADDSAGVVIRSFDVDGPSTLRLRAQSTDDSNPALAIAVGRDPSEGVSPVRLGAIASAGAGLVIGLGLIALSRRRRSPAPAAVIDPWSTTLSPTSPPGVAGQPPSAGVRHPVGPPTHPPGGPSPFDPGTAPAGMQIPGQPQTPVAPPVAPSAPSPWAEQTPVSRPGSAGDGERSPWAPPDTPNQQ